MRRPYETFLLFAALALILDGCRAKKPPVDAWYVVAMQNRQWTLIHTDHTKQQQFRFVVTCDWYKWDDHEAVPGDCDLPIGKILVWNGLPDEPANFVDIWTSGNYLFITEGDGKDRVSQAFVIQTASTETLDSHLPPAKRPRTLSDTRKK